MGREEVRLTADTARIKALEQQVAELRAEMESLRKSRGIQSGTQLATMLQNLVVHPLLIVTASLGAALAFAALVILDSELAKAPDQHRFFLIYMVPIAAPFAAFLLDRAQRWLFAPVAAWQQYAPLAVDLPLVVLGFARALYAVPFISGHALFLVYALLTVRSRAAQMLIVIVLAEVIYFKAFVWHDPTLYGGAIAAAVAAGLFHLVIRQQPKAKLTL